MSAMSQTATPIAIFGDLDGDIWGVVVGGAAPRAAVARLLDAEIELRSVALDLDDGEVWTASGAGCALRVERAAAGTASADGADTIEPCRVSGSAMLAGREREFDAGGIRADALSLDKRDSLRLFAAWFPAGHEVALLSARPRGVKGHDRDNIAAVARGEEHPLVIDPRLSTTYDQAGIPRRVGVELWLGEDEEGELWPRRVAGTATGSHAAVNGFSAYAFECASRGERGAGVYLLARP